MKMTKKILIGAVAAAAMAFTFTGCEFVGDLLSGKESVESLFMKEYGTENVLKYTSTDSEANGVYSVDYKNETDTRVRSIKFLQTKKYDISGAFEFNPQSSSEGVLGLVLDGTVNEDEEGNETSMNFITLGVRTNLSNKNAQFYISYFQNITEEGMNKDNFGVTTGTDKVEGSKETVIADFTTIPTIKINDDGKYLVYVDTKQDKTTGAYTIEFWQSTSDYKKDGDEAIKTVTIPVSKLNNKAAAAKAAVGGYVNVYADSSMKGSFFVMDTTNN